jgi:LacI family gluconate utilization system Gnt-I transcriptional repressor
MREGADAMARLLTELPDTEAVICVSDLSAFGALTECQRRGVEVPGRMAIAGFGAYDIADICVPTLTTVNPKPAEIGAATAKMVLSLLAAPQGRQVQQIVPVLQQGQSTGRRG